MSYCSGGRNIFTVFHRCSKFYKYYHIQYERGGFYGFFYTTINFIFYKFYVLVFPQTLVIQNLGMSLRGHLVPNASNVFREAWKMVNKVKDSERFMACAKAWIYFIVKHFKVNIHYS